VIAAYGYKNLIPALYENYFAAHDLRAQVLMRLPPNRLHALHHHLPQRRFVASDYYNDYFRHVTDGYWSIASWSPVRGEESLAFGVHRARGDDPDDAGVARLLGAVAPHLRKAAQLADDFSVLAGRVTQAEAALDAVPDAVILLDKSGLAYGHNLAADELVCQEHGLKVSADGAVLTEDAEAQRRIDGAIAEALGRNSRRPSGTCGIVVRIADGGAISLKILPAAGGAILLARRACPPAQAWSRFHLTPAELRLAQALALGQNLQQASANLHIARATAATQLRSIFAKTGTHRQAELVALAARMKDD
jgi:DNA-binding CsgD family transcriptional regulator